ncbi:MAG: hypothetical protein IKI45_01760 [Oscillospiraceae bacterium]|nr:hypothetical protein [Oscillospiraceae bacterium]
MVNNNNDPFLHWLTLAIPVLILGGGVFTLLTALTGWPRFYENSQNPQMQDQLARWGKNKARIIHALVSLLMLAFGGYLLYCWLFGPVQR